MEYSSFVTLVRNFQEADDDEDDDASQEDVSIYVCMYVWM
jgi:hypothetical protein